MRVSVSDQMVDMRGPEQEVEVLYRNDCLWVNVDGKCRLRIYDCPPHLVKIDVEKMEGSEVRRTRC